MQHIVLPPIRGLDHHSFGHIRKGCPVRKVRAVAKRCTFPSSQVFRTQSQKFRLRMTREFNVLARVCDSADRLEVRNLLGDFVRNFMRFGITDMGDHISEMVQNDAT